MPCSEIGAACVSTRQVPRGALWENDSLMASNKSPHTHSCLYSPRRVCVCVSVEMPSEHMCSHLVWRSKRTHTHIQTLFTPPAWIFCCERNLWNWICPPPRRPQDERGLVAGMMWVRWDGQTQKSAGQEATELFMRPYFAQMQPCSGE